LREKAALNEIEDRRAVGSAAGGLGVDVMLARAAGGF